MNQCHTILFLFIGLLFLGACGDGTTDTPPEEIPTEVEFLPIKNEPPPVDPPPDPNEPPPDDPPPSEPDTSFDRLAQVPVFDDLFQAFYKEAIDPGVNAGFVETDRVVETDPTERVTTTYDCPGDGTLVTTNQRELAGGLTIRNYDADYTDCAVSLILFAETYAEILNGNYHVQYRSSSLVGSIWEVNTDLQVTGDLNFVALTYLTYDSGSISNRETGDSSFDDGLGNVFTATYEEISAYDFPIYGPAP